MASKSSRNCGWLFFAYNTYSPCRSSTAAHTSAWVNMASAVTTVPTSGGRTPSNRRAALCSLVFASTRNWAITADACGA